MSPVRHTATATLAAALFAGTVSAADTEPAAGWTTNDGQLVLSGVPAIPPDLVERVRHYQNVRSASFVDWSGDGKSMFVSTRFADLEQVHRVATAGGSRKQLTWFPEPVGQVVRRENGEELAITMDEGGGELDQVFLFDPRNAETRRVSDGHSRNRLLCWSRDGRRLAFQSTRRNGRSNDLWIMDPDRPGSEELLLEAPPGTWYGPVDFSNDGQLLLVQQFLGVDDSRIYLLDLKTRALRLVAGDPQRPSANRAVTFDRRDEGFFYITNARGRAAELAWRASEPGSEPLHLTARINWDVHEFALSEDGRRGAFVTNENGASRLYLLDTRKYRYALVENVPLGVISGLKFNPDNRRLAMTISTPQTPSDAYVLQLGRRPVSARALTRWTYSEVGGLDADQFSVPELIHYPTFDQVGDRPRLVPAFVYRPQREPRGGPPLPVIIHVHGGPEAQYRPSFSKRTQMWVAELGAAVIAPNIRGSSGYDLEYLALDNGYLREDAVRDIGALLEWIATQPDLDQDRVAIHGSSYGGYVVLAAAVYYSDRLRAGIDEVGISNFVSFLENTEDYRRAFRRYEYGDERDPQMRTFLQRISPLNNVDRIAIPLLVVQGRNDPRVPASESEQIVRALRERGRPVWHIEALNEGHGFERRENRNIYEQAAILFLRQYLLD
jgi:dipeptidyl aminopeptidase/acylaminoacyl peptidase